MTITHYTNNELYPPAVLASDIPGPVSLEVTYKEKSIIAPSTIMRCEGHFHIGVYDLGDRGYTVIE